MQFCKSGKCRRRKVQTLILIGVVIVIYFLLQFLTLSKLGYTQTQWNKRRFQDQDVVDIAESDAGDKISNDFDKGKADSAERVNQQFVRNSVPRGVHPSDAALYLESTPGIFRCSKSGMLIHILRVNDDFCDCPDSSDEPGTSACLNGRFYCKVQLPNRDAQFVHSSKVNDGICDCCDGSDEWAGHSVPSIMQLDGMSGAVFHTPCLDWCGDVLKQLEDAQRIRRQGLLLQSRYLNAAKNLSSHDQKKFGPGGIFYLLSQSCYEHSDPNYRYTVCPFHSVKQSSGHTVTVLGLNGRWTQQKSGDFILNMNQGDASLCPTGQPRKAQVHFLCGLLDHIISVSEEEKCLYFIRFSTPAAC